jgi:hypothetical protein
VIAGCVILAGWPLAEALRASGAAFSLVLAVVIAASVILSLAVVAIWLRRRRGDFGWLADELRHLRRRRAAR